MSEQRRSKIKKNLAKMALVIVFLVGAFLLKMMLERTEETKSVQVESEERVQDYAEPVSKDNPILKIFLHKFPTTDVLLACEEDVTNDQNKDLVVIYKQDDLTRMVVLTDSGNHVDYYFSEPIPAPIENQKIQFKNIDKEAEIEIIVTGEKKGAVGYAIYRIIDGEPIDLFGEGMEDCC